MKLTVKGLVHYMLNNDMEVYVVRNDKEHLKEFLTADDIQWQMGDLEKAIDEAQKDPFIIKMKADGIGV